MNISTSYKAKLAYSVWKSMFFEGISTDNRVRAVVLFPQNYGKTKRFFRQLCLVKHSKNGH